MPKYSYKHENETFRLYEDENPISTPHGNPVVSKTEERTKYDSAEQIIPNNMPFFAILEN